VLLNVRLYTYLSQNRSVFPLRPLYQTIDNPYFIVIILLFTLLYRMSKLLWVWAPFDINSQYCIRHISNIGVPILYLYDLLYNL